MYTMNLSNPNAEWIFHQTNIDVENYSHLGRLTSYRGMIYYIDFLTNNMTIGFTSNGTNFSIWNSLKAAGASTHGLTDKSHSQIFSTDISVSHVCWYCEKCIIYLYVERLHIFANYD